MFIIVKSYISKIVNKSWILKRKKNKQTHIGELIEFQFQDSIDLIDSFEEKEDASIFFGIKLSGIIIEDFKNNIVKVQIIKNGLGFLQEDFPKIINLNYDKIIKI